MSSFQETLPKGWTIAKLGDLCFTTSGGTPSRKVPNFYSGNIPWVKSGELDKGLILDTEEKITEEAIQNSSAKIFPVGTLLIALYGATVGKLAFLGVPAATNQAVCGIYESEAIDSHLLYYFLLFQRGNLIKQSIGGAQPNISQGIIKDLSVPLAPLNEQKRILAKLEQLLTDLEKGIEYLETTKQQLKVYRESVLKWAFEGKLTNKNLKQSKMPTGWTKTTLGEIVKKVSVKALPTEMPEAKFIGMDCIESNTMKPHMTYQFSQFKSAGNSFKANHVLYGRMRPYLNKVYKAEFDGVCSGEFIIMECLDGFNPELLKYILHQRDFVRFANQKTSGDRPRVSFEELEEYPIFKCSSTEQTLIVQEIESRLSVCDKIEETIESSLQQAEALRLSIIKKAFEGKLVPQDPNDEPAEKLLERIRAAKGKAKPEKKEKVKAERKPKRKEKIEI